MKFLQTKSNTKLLQKEIIFRRLLPHVSIFVSRALCDLPAIARLYMYVTQMALSDVHAN